MDDLEIEDVFADNRVYTFGKNECGQCGLGHTESPVYSPAPVPFFGGRNVVIVASGG
jgi:alpha-tubulin suppressor-like RCC1 family protein